MVDEALHLLNASNGDKDSIPALRKVQQALEVSLADCKAANDKYFEFLDREEAMLEVGWILVVQKRYNQVVAEIESHVTKVGSEIRSQSVEARQSNLRLEKIKMPKFDGELREYPRFKKDFEIQVMPSLNSATAPYTLRSCLGKEPLAVVKGVDDDITEMWKRLDEKYGDPAKVADAIIDSVQRVKTIKEGEDKRFIEFVEIVDSGYRDLLRIGLEKEITTTSSVSIIEKKLPPDIRKDWAKLVSSDTSSVEKKDKFPSLLKFLLNQKRAIEYDSADLRKPAQQSVNHVNAAVKEVGENDQLSRLSNSRFYLSKSWEERMNMPREKRACWSCLKIGHRIRDCRKRKVCGENGCTRTHHRTIHGESSAANVSATANTCSNPARDTCLLQLQRIKTKKGWANVMWDNAASLSFITNSKAATENLRGTRVELSIVKVGGQTEKFISQKYVLHLIDLQGRDVQFEVYGIDKITTDIQSVNIDDIVHYFKNVSPDEIKRPSGAVDVLIGYRYAGYHPEPERKLDHLLLLKNRFGRCLGGTHAAFGEAGHTMHNARVHHVSEIKIEDFFTIENLGVECTSRCGGCKCRKCPLGAENHRLKEEKELQLVEENLEFEDADKQWIAAYPWIQDPAVLPDNRRTALGTVFGDRPSGTIATVALRKTAEMGQEQYPEAAKIIKDNTYVDDIIESVRDNRKARDVTGDIEKLIDNGGFKVKGWIISGDPDNRDEMVLPDEKYAVTEKVLGVACKPVDDQFRFRVKLNFSERKRKLHTEPDLEPHQIPEKIPVNLTKRKILSQINSVYDRLGLAGPFTVRANIMMRQLWES